MAQNSQKIIQERRMRISEFFLRGYCQEQIADKTGVSQAQVSRDLKAISKAWQQTAESNIARVKAQDLMKLRRLERESNEGWARSKYKIVIEKDGDGKEVEKAIPLDGNPKFLEVVLKVIQRRGEMLGYDAPKQLDHTSGGKQLGPIILIDNGRDPN